MCRVMVRFYFAAIAVITISASAIGCGSSDGTVKYNGKLVPVTGTVTLDGQPVSEATITFLMTGTKPPDGFSSAKAVTDSTGRYQLRTDDKPGVPPGRYRVLIDRWATPDGLPFKDDPANGIDLVQAQMAGTIKQLIPEKYNDPTKSQVTVEVTEDRKDPVNFEMKSK